MPSCRKPVLDDHACHLRRAMLGLALWGAVGAAGGLSRVHAAEAATEPGSQIVVARHADGLYLSAKLALDISLAMEDVLRKGVPLYFLWQADVVQKRWYWSDKTVASTARTVRLGYQPLTRRWRLSYGAGVPSAMGLQYVLHQNYESLADALDGAARVTRWKIADAAQWTPSSGQRVEFRFSLDMTQLPRPFQLGVLNHSGWNITQQRTLAVPDRIVQVNEPDQEEEAVDADKGGKP